MAEGIGALQDSKILAVASDAVVDTANFEGVIFISDFVTASAGNSMELRDGDASDGSDQAAIADAELTGEATANVLAQQLHKPMKRYVSCTHSAAAAMIAILYGARSKAVTQDPAITRAENYVSPPNLRADSH